MAGVAPRNVPLRRTMKGPLRLEPLFPDRTTGEALAVQLVRRLRNAIETGALPPGTKMHGSRQLAKQLGLGRNTVALAFEQLIAEGYLEARIGSGTYVASTDLRWPAEIHASETVKPENARRIAALRTYFDIAAGAGPLRPGTPALSLFPTNAWNRAARRAFDAHDGNLGYGPSSGLRSLREAIALHVRQFRGITAQPEHVIVVEGAQAAMHLAATVLSDAGDTVAAEDPCYALARAVFELHGLRIHPTLVDGDGIRTASLPRNARLAFVTPTHQFPLGGTLTLPRRLELLAWAEERKAYILEDDYDSEFTAGARPLPALQSLDRDERVVYIGSFSKTLAPAIRVGYLIAPPHLADAFRAARATTSLGLSVHVQATLARFIHEGHFARHLRRMNAVYETRRSVLANALEPICRTSFDLGPMQVGLHVALVSRRPFPDQELSLTANGQRLVALSSLCLKRRDCYGYVLGFTNGDPEELRDAAVHLVGMLEDAKIRARAANT